MIATPGQTTTIRELRETTRFQCDIQTTCQPPSAFRKDPWPATIRNISTGGLCLQLSRRFERGTGLAIELPTEDGGTTTVLARVAHVESTERGAWILGCDFISDLSDEEVRGVLQLDPVHQASLDDANATRDQPVPTINGVLFQTRINGEVVRWFVKRLDLKGAWPLPEGKVLAFRVGTADSAPTEMKIKRCRRVGSYWIVDCKFVRELSGEVLRAITSAS